jgi:hypothetical protein
MDGVDMWLIVGIDPSLSRTGFAISCVRPHTWLIATQHPDITPTQTSMNWIKVGSIKPENASDPIWIRGKAMALYLRKQIESIGYDLTEMSPIPNLGLIISMEYPTPMNDFLVALNRIIHLVFFEDNKDDLSKIFTQVRVLTTNAATLRSLMNLKARGSMNKKENIIRAYEYIDRTQFPGLDTDSCDAVLLNMMGQYTSQILLGLPDLVPDRFKNSLCNSTKEVKGAGTRQRIITKGLLHRKEYWYPYERKSYSLAIKDATTAKATRLQHEQFYL